MASPFTTLGLPTTASTEEVKQRWRQLALQYHPDRGGDKEAFNLIRLAYDQCLRLIELRGCAACGGTGRVGITKGFSTTTKRCQPCRGTGKV